MKFQIVLYYLDITTRQGDIVTLSFVLPQFRLGCAQEAQENNLVFVCKAHGVDGRGHDERVDRTGVHVHREGHTAIGEVIAYEEEQRPGGAFAALCHEAEEQGDAACDHHGSVRQQEIRTVLDADVHRLGVRLQQGLRGGAEGAAVQGGQTEC